MNIKPTLLGHIGAVTGSSVSVRLAPSISSGIAIIGGKSYRIGQVGSFVRIPQGYHDLYGIVAEVGATAAPLTSSNSSDQSERWMTIQLVGEVVGSSFERGISQHPNIKDEVHLVTEEDLAIIYGNEDNGQIIIGRLANSEGIPVRIDLDKLITRHSAIMGSTGAGKSTTVASLLRSIALGGNSDKVEFPSARILLLDIHGEYHQALGDISTTFKINPDQGEHPLHIPFWALDTNDLITFLMGKLEDKQLLPIQDKIVSFKTKLVEDTHFNGIDLNSVMVDSPLPFSLNKLWYELIDPEIKTWENVQRTDLAILEEGDANKLKPPKYKPHGNGSTAPFINQVGVLGIRRALDQMKSRLLDRQFDFLLHPGPWEPDLDSRTSKDLSHLLEEWLGHDKPITILDLSGIPSSALSKLISTILKILYEGLYWGRNKSEGGTSRPLLVVMEEAHRYLSKEANEPAREIVQRIVKEGRKFGIGAMIVSQRPSEVDETILSQCGTFISLRLSNTADRNKIQSSLPDNLAGIIDSLPVLRTGEAIITGEAARLPIRCRITLPEPHNRPRSEDPLVSANWKKERFTENYDRVTASWRSQNPSWVYLRVLRTTLKEEEINSMERDNVESSMVISIGFEPSSNTLEVEFKNSSIYQYYNVPSVIHDQLMASDSKGKFINVYIKPAYAYSRI